MSSTAPKKQAQSIGQNIILWATYLAIGAMVYYTVYANMGLDPLVSAAIGATAALFVIAISEILDKKYGWTKNKKENPLTASEYIKANPGAGHRTLIRGFVEQGGTAEDIKAELSK